MSLHRRVPSPHSSPIPGASGAYGDKGDRADQLAARSGAAIVTFVADPLVSSSYLQMAIAVASRIGRWRVLDAFAAAPFLGLVVTALLLAASGP